MTKNFIEDNRFREKDNAAKIIEIMNSFDNVASTTVFYDVDDRPSPHLLALRLALLAALAACFAGWLARRRS